MDFNLITEGARMILSFLLNNIAALLFIGGLVSIIYAVFLFSTVGGFLAIGGSLILIALILVREQQEQ